MFEDGILKGMRSSGFSLLEILIAVFIIIMLATAAVFSFGSLRNSTSVSTTAGQIVSALQLARSQTVSGVNDTNFGVHFETNQYVLFEGTTYDSNAASNEVYPLSDSVEINTITLSGGGSEVVFDRIEGTTGNDGSIEIRSTADTTQTATVTVLPSGLIGMSSPDSSSSATPTPSPSSSRITDTRHMHFDLGYSIQGASTMTLTFQDPPEPDVVQQVNMPDFFNAGQTDFDWEGTITVSGSGQTLRIHTHSITPTTTELSITRDGRYNDKALIVKIDGQTIVSYAADGTATVGSGGGTMTAQ